MKISPTEYCIPREVSTHAIKAESSVFLDRAGVLNGKVSVVLSSHALDVQKSEHDELHTCRQNLQGRNQL